MSRARAFLSARAYIRYSACASTFASPFATLVALEGLFHLGHLGHADPHVVRQQLFELRIPIQLADQGDPVVAALRLLRGDDLPGEPVALAEIVKGLEHYAQVRRRASVRPELVEYPSVYLPVVEIPELPDGGQRGERSSRAGGEDPLYGQPRPAVEVLLRDHVVLEQAGFLEELEGHAGLAVQERQEACQ